MRSVLVVSALVMLSACNSTPRQMPLPNDPFFAPVIPEMPRQKVAEDGSLFHPARLEALYTDPVAFRIGDILTVVLQENTTAQKSANTTTSRESGVELDPIIGFGGNESTINGQSITLDVESETDFSGDAQSAQSNSLLGNISVTVVDVLPNRNLVVRGEKWLTLNSGNEYVRLTGIVRPIDIGRDNQIPSNRIANARIQYSGTGNFAEAQEPGWASRFFSSRWWPF